GGASGGDGGAAVGAVVGDLGALAVVVHVDGHLHDRVHRPAGPDQRVGDVLGLVDRDREAQPYAARLRGAAERAAAAVVGRLDRGVDADDRAAGVEQRAAGVAGVDRGVGLQRAHVGSRRALAVAGGD